MLTIDLNCDMGESFGAYTIGDDVTLMDYVSSVNIACGFHAGDPSVMRKTVALAVQKNVAIGAHPGYPDLGGFGRREMKMTSQEVYDMVVYQVGALMAFVTAAGSELRHVKPHGALYNTAAKEGAIASAIARAVKDVSSNLVFVGLSGSVMIGEASVIGLRTASEVFGDRTYQDDGSLTPRFSPQALIADPHVAATQVLQMVRDRSVYSLSGKRVPVKAETVCLHGDSPTAALFARTIVNHLAQHDVTLRHL